MLTECLYHESQEIQAIATEGMAKLMLSRMLNDKEVCCAAESN
jgi:hypothetical protein